MTVLRGCRCEERRGEVTENSKNKTQILIGKPGSQGRGSSNLLINTKKGNRQVDVHQEIDNITKQKERKGSKEDE